MAHNDEKRETVEEYLSRGGKVTKCPPVKGPSKPILTARSRGAGWISGLIREGCFWVGPVPSRG